MPTTPPNPTTPLGRKYRSGHDEWLAFEMQPRLVRPDHVPEARPPANVLVDLCQEDDDVLSGLVFRDAYVGSYVCPNSIYLTI